MSVILNKNVKHNVAQDQSAFPPKYHLELNGLLANILEKLPVGLAMNRSLNVRYNGG